jgi:ABC-type phosphate transport system substrate-binding protein
MRALPVKPLAVLLLMLTLAATAAAEVVVIGHPGLSKLDGATVQRIFTGKVIEVGGVPVTAVNAIAGSSVRREFLERIVEQNEEKYTAYWTVRRYIGKGAPPRELPTSAEVIRFVMATPGAVGYIDDGDLRAGLNVLLRR